MFALTYPRFKRGIEAPGSVVLVPGISGGVVTAIRGFVVVAQMILQDEICFWA